MRNKTNDSLETNDLSLSESFKCTVALGKPDVEKDLDRWVECTVMLDALPELKRAQREMCHLHELRSLLALSANSCDGTS